MTDDLKKLAYSVDEAAALAGIGRDAVYGAVRAGKLTAKKLGKRTLITSAALAQFLDSLPPLTLPPADGERHEP